MPELGHLLLLSVSVFWALNMGASGLSVSFAPAYGGGLVGRTQAVLLFTAFVLAGALLVGGGVAETLRSGVVPAELISVEVASIILGGAAASLFIANWLAIPQSTSILIVGSFAGAGLFFGELDVGTLLRMVALWVSASLVAYLVTYLLARVVYPPRAANLFIYEKVFKHRRKLAVFTIVSNIYSAFGIGTNNVANVAGPVAAATTLSILPGLLLFAPLFGLGGALLGRRVLETTGKGIVPLGEVSAAIVSLVTASLVIFASALGLPAPYVQISMMAILAIATVKHETPHLWTFRGGTGRRLLAVWLVTPLFSTALTATLLFVRGR
jgi:sulfate permease